MFFLLKKIVQPVNSNSSDFCIEYTERGIRMQSRWTDCVELCSAEWLCILITRAIRSSRNFCRSPRLLLATPWVVIVTIVIGDAFACVGVEDGRRFCLPCAVPADKRRK